MKHTCQVSVLQTNRDFFDYAFAPENPPCVGARVWVPFRKSTRLGIVISHHESEHQHVSLKPITQTLDDTPFLSEELFALCRWISRYYHASLALVFSLALPKRYRLGHAITNKTTITSHQEPLASPLKLNPEQHEAVECISQQLHKYHCYLLHGVTGSGKTEVYLHLIQRVLQANKQILVLVPEIGLTPQLLARFRIRFCEPMAVIHSHMTDTERAQAWYLARENHIKLIIGTRAALFTPMPALGLIIIDEEHDPSLKQMEGVRFSARDAALIRAQHHNIPIILGSATPSAESLHNCMLQKYTKLRLTHKALNNTPLHYQLIDIRNQALKHGLAETTKQIIAEHVEKKSQVLVFINRRGFAPVLLCHQCGWMVDCDACDSHLTLHRRTKELICHHCGFTRDVPTHCHECQQTELLPIGAGTQRIHQALSTQFPEHNIVRIDRDEVRHNAKRLSTQLERIHEGEADIIVGTQMLAKGHHFPNLCLVVILDTDAGFYNQDFRALERLGQLLTQVSGRAGRANLAGRVLIQTHFPHHPLLHCLIQDGYDAFIHALLPLRKEASWPPYAFLALIRVHGKKMPPLLSFLHDIKNMLAEQSLTVLGPAPAPLARKAMNHHMQLLIKAPSRKALHGALAKLRSCINDIPASRQLRWSIDVDPIELG